MGEIEDAIDSGFEWFEHGLNTAGYLPIVSTVSGSLRVSFGKLEVIGAIVVAAFIAIKALFNPDPIEKYLQLEKATQILVKYSLHGAANVLRGTLEIFPLLSLVTCLPYDLSGKRFAYVRESYPGTYLLQQLGS